MAAMRGATPFGNPSVPGYGFVILSDEASGMAGDRRASDSWKSGGGQGKSVTSDVSPVHSSYKNAPDQRDAAVQRRMSMVQRGREQKKASAPGNN
ncbi:hypothetical protein MTO96_010531 [Rhipicephalus appendiculatus]